MEGQAGRHRDGQPGAGRDRDRQVAGRAAVAVRRRRRPRCWSRRAQTVEVGTPIITVDRRMRLPSSRRRADGGRRGAGRRHGGDGIASGAATPARARRRAGRLRTQGRGTRTRRARHAVERRRPPRRPAARAAARPARRSGAGGIRGPSSRSRRSASSPRTSASTSPMVDGDRPGRRDHPRRRDPAGASQASVFRNIADAGVAGGPRGAHPGQGRAQGDRARRWCRARSPPRT